MSQELFFTSAPRGLQAGSSGFCTVAVTRGLPPSLRERLEALSAYRHLLPPLDPNNPVAYSHLRLSVAGRTYHVLSRIGPAGLDYSQRSNKFAHHVVLGPGELPPGGPAWLLQQPGFMAPTWDGQVRELAAGRTPPMSDGVPALCRAWQKLAGDAGWAGVLAEAFERDPNQTVYLVFQPGQEMLPLLAEAVALLPPEKRWQVTFSSYYTGVSPGTSCAWRCVAKGSAEAKEAGGLPNTLALDLTAPLGAARGGLLVEQARNGRPAVPPPPRAEPEWPGEAPPIVNRRAERAPARTRSMPLPPPPPPVAKPARWRTRALWMTIGLLVGISSTSAVTAVLASSGAVTLELKRHEDELRASIDDRQNELERLEEQRAAANDGFESKKKQVGRLEEECKAREKKIAELSAEFKKKKQEQQDLESKLQKSRMELESGKKQKDDSTKKRRELESHRAVIRILKEKTESDGEGLRLGSAIDAFLDPAQNKTEKDLKREYDGWYAHRIDREAEPYLSWKTLLQSIKDMKSSLKADTEAKKLEYSQRIVEEGNKIRKQAGTLAFTKLFEQSQDVLLACESVIEANKDKNKDHVREATSLRDRLKKPRMRANSP